MKHGITICSKRQRDETKSTLRNVKVEITVILISIIGYVLVNVIPHKCVYDVDWMGYFNQERLNGIAAFFSITVGIYVTIVTILATSRIGISKEILEKNLDKGLINVIIFGMSENLLAVAMSIFIPLNKTGAYILLVLLIVSVISFVKFILLLVIIFKANLNKMARDIDQEEQYSNEMLGTIKEIQKNLRK